MKYTGELNTPIAEQRIGLLATDEQIAAIEKSTVDKRLEKLPLLAAAHGIEHGDWFSLAYALACEYVPGFKIREASGRPTQWEDYDKAMLKIDVDEYLHANPGRPVTQAITTVSRREQWASKTKGMKIDAIKKHYYSADVRMVRIALKARDWEKMGLDR